MNKTIEIIRRNSQPLEPLPTGLDIKLNQLDGIQAVVFDIYGTLFVSGSGDVGLTAEHPGAGSLVKAGAAIGLDFSSVADGLIKKFFETIHESHRQSRSEGVEFPEVDILEIWKNTLGDQSLDEPDLRTLAIEFESRMNPVWAMPKLAETLERLRGDFQMGIVSNAQFFTLELFEALLGASRSELGFDPELEVFSFSERTAKPGLPIFEIAKERLTKKGIRPEKVLYVGNDMLNDIRGAKLIGFRTALFAGDKRSLRLRKEDQRVDGVVPDIIVNCLSQIPDLLN